MAIMLFLSHLLLLLLQFSSSLAYSPPDKYFLNCGSKSDTELINKRRFIGDAKDGGWSINPGKSKVVENNTIPTSINEIYQTARIYKKPTWYVFGNINPNGTYVVRLHFFPTLPQIMSQARFNVSASCGFQLLSNFSVENDLKTPIVKEFSFEVKEGPFGIQFSPVESSLAFVNAIEVFLAPEDLKPDSAYPLSPEVRMNTTNYMLTSQAFQAVYRMWMGNFSITPDHDTLWRTWLPDSKFMPLPSPAKSVTFNGKLSYNEQLTTYIAPSDVYANTKALDMNTTTNSRDSALTWVFNVKKKSKYFLRLIWCDIVSRSTTFNFVISIGVNETSLSSRVVTELNEFAMPFWYEFIVVTDNSGFFNVGIALDKNDPFSRAFLNGVEIMELIEKSFVGVVDLRLNEEKQSPKMIIVGVCVGGIVIVGLVIGLALFCFVKGQKSRRHRPLLVPQDDPSSEKIVSIADLAPNLNIEWKIPFREINDATDGFDEKKMIGIGGFGKVYFGRIRGKDVAVKRSLPGHGQGIKEFQTEVIIFSEIRYRFLVTLYGYCDENQEMILVYEYMEGGTLKDYLYGSKAKDRVPLSWKKRLEICIDAAKGLDYLHTDSTAGVIVHRDIKTTNILLDKDMKAKVADFGISKTGVPGTKELDITIKGTLGYMDPECFNTGKFTEKSDVYAFGVVLFEVLSARAPIDKTLPSEETNLADWAVLCKSRGEIEKVIDPFLVGTIEGNSLRKYVEVAVRCVDEVGANRPSMHDVVYDLELALQFQFTPVGDGKGYEGISTTIVEAPWEIDSGILDRIPSKGIDDSVMLQEDSTTVRARELAAEFKIDCPR
ncbi:probable receptor-like protein kinase At2g23200 [Benincasa hispida]|uniref:probable receptor-like protein kinase At2g23200 n=1 Tax=Benincasa hispida TaxID=102211 RepID=UPI0018FF3DEB|nr:probable receptor-like protein kinase At2g23200 [Benincasa hispida]